MLVDLRRDVQPPERLPQLEQVAAVGRVVLRGLHGLQRGPLRLACCSAWARTASQGAICRSLGRSGILSRTLSAPRRASPACRSRAASLDLGVRVGLALGPAGLRRVRRAGHHVEGVLLPARVAPT